MKKATKFDLRALLVLILSVTLCFTAVFAACGGNDDSSSSSSSSSTEEDTYPTDTQLLKNGDFEYSTFTKEDTDFPVSSSISWTIGSDSVGSSSAISSSGKYPSGIIDTADDAYEALLEDSVKANKNLPEENPRTPEYYKLVDTSKMYSMDQFNNGTENEDKLPMSGTKILMLHNHTTVDGEGTARKFTSSSVTLARNEYAELSVWIKTVDLSSKMHGAVGGKDYGAYVSVQSTISSSAAPLILKNIDTKGAWAKYTVYLSSSDFSTSSFKLVLGLGFGSATVTDEFVQGYAFFDNAVFKTISKTDYDAAIGALDDDNRLNLYELGGDVYSEKAKSEFVKSQEGTTYKVNGTKDEGSDVITPYEGDYDETTAENYYTEVKYGLSHTRDGKLAATVIDTITEGTPVKNMGNDATAAIGTMSAAYTAAGLTETADQLPGVDSAKALYFVFDQASSYSYTTGKLTLESGKYLKLSFWVKAEVENMCKNALTVTLKDFGNASSPEEGSNIVETVLLDNKNTDDYENKNYNGWLQYVLFLSNTIDEDGAKIIREFEIEFSFGISADDYADDWDLTKGFAIIGNFEGYYMSASDYSIADTSSYTYAKKVALSADLANGAPSTETDDSYKYNYPETDKLNLAVNGTTNSVNGYQFVKAGSNAVGGSDENVYGSNASDVNGGLISSKHYSTDSDKPYSAIHTLEPFDDNKDLLSMYISAAASTPVSYGFIGSSATFAANSTTYVSVSVYATEGAKAYFYLTSDDALDGFGIISLTAKDYTFNDNTLAYTYKDDYKVNKSFVQSLEGTAGDAKWYTLSFLVTTGNESISYRPEFWLGSRDGSGSTGTVYFDNYVTTTVSLNEKKAELKNMGASENDVVEYTRIPTVVKYNEVISDEDSSESASESSDVKKTFIEYKATNVYVRYEATDLSVLSYDFSTIDVEHEIDKTTVSVDDDEDSSSSDEDSISDGTDFNWALQLTSIIIAAVLIVLLVVVLVKMLLDKKPRKTRTEQYYNRNSREEAGEKALRKQLDAAKADERAEDDVEEYDYDNPEINNNDLINASQDETAEDTASKEIVPADDTDAGEGSDESTDTDDGSAE